MMKKIIYACLAIVFVAGCARASKNTENEIRLSICHYKFPGMGESVQLCYVINTGAGKKEFFYDDIQGFAFQWGYNYTITVEKKNVGTAKADASSTIYKLKKIIKKERVLPNVEFELPVIFNEQVVVENNKGVCSYLQDINIQTAAYSCADLSKARSAVFRYSADGKGLVLVKIK